MTDNRIRQIKLSKLIAHPLNPNRMSDNIFRKLIRNIQQRGNYEPIIVRKHPKNKGFFQIINGCQRVMALKKLNIQKADCIIWDVDDEQVRILLATLNRLSGRDVLDKKLKLLKRLKSNCQLQELARLLPLTKKQLEKLANLKLPPLLLKPAESTFAKPIVFFVTDPQLKIIEKALSLAEDNSAKQTKPEKKALALAKIVNKYINECS